MEMVLHKELEEVLLQEKLFWMQKLRCEFISLSDKNTKYFYVCTIARRRRNKIVMLQDADGN